MRAILWCGGSHLASARSAIEHAHRNVLANFSADFLVTAGPVNRDWMLKGGRYRVEGSRVSGNPVMGSRIVDLSAYCAIVFVGQFLNRIKVFQGGHDLSAQVVDRVLKDIPSRIYFMNPAKGYDGFLENEPLNRFPALVPGPSFLIPDPPPVNTGFEEVPRYLKQCYDSRLARFCEDRDMVLVPISPLLLTEDDVPRAEYHVENDPLHMNSLYWERVISDALIPRLVSRIGQSG